MQRTLAGQELVTDPSGFEQSLSTRQGTALGTPLGHLVSPDAPAGLVHGLTAPAPVGPQPPPTAQRSVEMPMRAETVPVQLVYGGGAPAMTSAGERAVADLPVRQLVGEQTLVPRSALPRPGDAGPSGSGAVQRAAEPPAAEPARRAPGLGAPLAGLPPTAQRSAAASVPGSGGGSADGSGGGAGSGSEGGAAPVPVSRSAEDGPGMAEAAAPDEGPEPPSVGTDVSGPTAPLLGDDPLVGAVSGGVSSAVSSGGAGVGGEASGADLQRSTGIPGAPGGASGAPVAPGPTSPLPTAPLLGDRPLALRTTAGPEGGEAPIGPAVQRSPEGPSGGVAGTGPGAGPGPGPLGVPNAVPVRWTTADTYAGAGTYAGAPAVQRTVVASPGAPSTASRLPVQRRTGQWSPGGGGRSASPTAGAFAVAAGVAQRMPDGSVVFGSPSAASASPPSGTSRPVVQRDAEISEEPPPPDPVPDMATGPESEPESEADSESASAGAAGAPASRAGGGGAPGQAGAPPVTDELVRALYAPLSRLLKADLRLERERAGFLINTRH
ncbi:hypothetical protein OG413_09965 [Streptomyces sp. NBC_01433]|uniref:hypothetical protein n=1 Tax=Streptomyces sp. NBC_01433 TaxID=2903864 RepID=UPI00225600FF|nr:hypothetical protein [Streptomyces sp. NBC_01433]MCX4675629.1 hypothetical protein [Streptomyces sp. NBC_01433]